MVRADGLPGLRLPCLFVHCENIFSWGGSILLHAKQGTAQMLLRPRRYKASAVTEDKGDSGL